MDKEFEQDRSSHDSGTRKGEELGGSEPGRHRVLAILTISRQAARPETPRA